MKLAHLFRCTLTCISPKLNTKVTYRMKFRKKLDLKNPKNLREKILYLKLRDYATHPLIRQCADKYAVRDYIEKQGCGEILIPLIAAYDRVEDIPWEDLPDAFAMKWNFGCGFNLICPDKTKLNIPAAKEKLERWRKTRYHLGYSEMQYKGVPKKILVEKYLKPKSGALPDDYKIYCFHGEPKATLYMSGRHTSSMQAVFMDNDWNLLGETGKKKYVHTTAMPEKPASFEAMLDYARKLSAPFPFVRMDFYEIDGKVYFGEMTFTPAGGYDVSQCLVDGKPMGDLVDHTQEIKNPVL